MLIRLLDENGNILTEFADNDIDWFCIIEWRKRYFSYSDSDGDTYIAFTQKPLVFKD